MHDVKSGLPSALPPGLYEHLLTEAMQRALDGFSDPRLYSTDGVDPEDAHAAISQFLEHLISGALSRFRGADSAERQKRMVNRLLQTLAAELQSNDTDHLNLSTPLRRLLAIRTTAEDDKHRPDTQLARSALLTGTRLDPSLGTQIRKEIATGDRVDILCSFVRWSGLRIILPELERLTASGHPNGPRLRVITTSYMGATDPRAVEALRALPNTEVRVSYDTQRTRLHAKAYLIHRSTGFGSAYVGSANLSHAALSEGLEWTTKVSQYELAYLWAKIVATFETYWQDEEFDPYTEQSAPRFRSAISRERAASDSADTFAALDVRPYPFQEEILDLLAAERQIQGKFQHLVVAATGTGKTVVSALDYQRWCQQTGTRLSLLFIAHREELLRQALGTFRAVLRDQNFGDLLVGGRQPEQSEHLFCSIQSYNSQMLWNLPAERHAYVVVDEFHHAAAPSYRRLLDHVRPQVLLGLTATPERTDQLDILQWFGGVTSAEIRLPDAINRRLLCPFQYFGVADSVDLDGLTWQRGGYRTEDLDRVYTGNDVRAALIVRKVHEILLDPLRSRGLGFCVSIAHAEYMAKFFSDHGIPSISLSAESVKDVRSAAQQRLRGREVNFIFVVDLYNEGVDIPEVDVVLFLRPTESLTVYLQQFGRGLRLHGDKECLTVLDFIGAQRREFRFAPRFRALSTQPAAKLDTEIEEGCPHLPTGCYVHLERVAQQRILQNVRESLGLYRPRMVASIRELAAYLGRTPTIEDALSYLDTSLEELLKRGLWSRLLADAGAIPNFVCPDEKRLAAGLRRICHIDDPDQIRSLLAYLDAAPGLLPHEALSRRRMEMLHVSLWGSESAEWTLEKADASLRANQIPKAEVRSVLEYRLSHTRVQTRGVIPELAGPLAIHAQYTRDEALVGLGHWSMVNRPDMREGVLHLPKTKVDAFFVTLQKAEHQYSPTTMYEDYAISHDLFHWQSQSTTSAESGTGQRYIAHRHHGYTPLLFVRETKKLASGLTAPYAFLGPCEYVSHEGSRPMSIVWRLRHPIPARLFRTAARQSVG